jgi:hypothetical protein
VSSPRRLGGATGNRPSRDLGGTSGKAIRCPRDLRSASVEYVGGTGHLGHASRELAGRMGSGVPLKTLHQRLPLLDSRVGCRGGERHREEDGKDETGEVEDLHCARETATSVVQFSGARLI